MRDKDPSDFPAFYDPEHPEHHLMPTTGESLWWVEVLCDDGEQHGWGGWAFDADEAKDYAWDDAVGFGKRPLLIESCEVQA